MHNTPIGLPEETAQAVIGPLNVDLASLYTLYHQVKKHHWLVEGPHFRDLHLLWDELAGHLLKWADQVAERITALGGCPISAPAEQQRMACFVPEAEGEFPLRTMLENDRTAYLALIREVRGHVTLAWNKGDFGSAHLLQQVLLELENDVHHLDHVLRPLTL